MPHPCMNERLRVLPSATFAVPEWRPREVVQTIEPSEEQLDEADEHERLDRRDRSAA